MNYQVHDAADYGVPQRRKRVIFLAHRKEMKHWQNFSIDKEYGKDGLPWIQTIEAIGELPPIQAGEQWGIKGKNAVIHPYGYNRKDGYVICPSCLKYNLQERKTCHHCNYSLTNPIRGGIVHLPGLGTLLDTQVDVDNAMLRNLF